MDDNFTNGLTGVWDGGIIGLNFDKHVWLMVVGEKMGLKAVSGYVVGYLSGI